MDSKLNLGGKRYMEAELSVEVVTMLLILKTAVRLKEC